LAPRSSGSSTPSLTTRAVRHTWGVRWRPPSWHRRPSCWRRRR
jgi:hypothetical protein